MAKNSGPHHRARLRLGAKLLAAAKADPRPEIRALGAKLERSQNARAIAQEEAEAAQTALAVAQQNLVDHDREMNAAIDAFAKDLIAAGHPAENPFAPYGGATPAALKALPRAEKARQVGELIAQMTKAGLGT